MRNGPNAGRTILDLEAERARLEYALEHLNHADQPDLVARMQARLEIVTDAIRQEGW
jgi:hypothetical protein